jgi:iron complex outermembrane receptor protein
MKNETVKMMRVGAKTRIALLATAVSIVGIAPAMAQDLGGEIVVTALKRDTRLQDTPLAISAVTGASLEKAGTTSFTELTQNTPSLRIVDNGPGNRRVILRGIVGAGEPTVGMYYDESPVAGSVGTTSDAAGSTPDFRIFDVERAEVLRGPQGTLYGSGSMGGTVRIIYEKPKADRVEGAMAMGVSAVEGGAPGASVDGMINLPLVNDVLALRVVGGFQQFAGFVDNSYYGTKNINDGYSYSGRALLRFTPTDRLTLDLGAYLTKVSTDSSRWILETGEKYTTNGRAESGNYDKNRIYSGTLRYDFDTVSLTAVSTYFDRDRIVMNDVSDNFNGRAQASLCGRYLLGNAASTCSDDQLDAYLTETNAILTSSLYQPQSVRSWTNEVRLSSTSDGPFGWTVGGFLEDRKSTVRSTLLAGDPATGDMLPFVSDNIYYDRTVFDRQKQKALFAELSYTFFDKLTATGGVRWFDYDKTVGGIVDKGQMHYSSVAAPFVESSTKEDGFVYKANLSYEFSRDLMIYAQAAQGFRPGGVNQAIGLAAALAAYSSDSLWNYEIGVKSQPIRGVYLNVTGYQIDWDNMQVSGRTTGDSGVFGLISNVGAARVRGMELELTATPYRGFNLNVNAGYTDAKLSEDQVSDVVVAAGRKGDRLTYVPKWNVSGSADYTWDFSETLEGTVRLDGAYVGSSYSTLAASDQYRRKVDSYALFNARVGVQAPDGDWSAQLFVNNLFNATAITTKSASGNQSGLTLTYSAPPRTYGLNFTKRFR